jgi:hypothetical protein
MLLRSALFATVASLASLSPSNTIRYRIDQQIEQRIDLSVFGQGEQVQNQALVWFTTMTYTDSAGGQAVHVVLDSVQADLGMAPFPASMLDSLKGAAFHGFLDSQGRMGSVGGNRKDLLAGAFEGLLKTFHPRVRTGTRAGDSWVDTLNIETDNPQSSTKTRTITNFTLAGTEQREGVAARRLEAAFTATLTGTVQTPAGPADMEGKSTGTATYFLSPEGRYLGGQLSSAGDATMSGSFAPAAIPMKNSTTMTVTVIK